MGRAQGGTHLWRNDNQQSTGRQAMKSFMTADELGTSTFGALPLANRLDEATETLNTSFAVVFIGSSLRILWEKVDPLTGKRTVLFLSPQDFRTLTKNQAAGDADAKSVAEFFLAHPKRRQYESIDFIPGPTPEGVYNLWKGFAVESKQGTTTKFWNFTLEVICGGDKVLFGFLRKWLAHLVQKPNNLDRK